MCSICGAINFKDGVSPEKAEKMSAVMKRRGPDDSGVFFDGQVAFSHNRLAVMDVKNGAQPMAAEFCGRKFVIVYNGEIYNSPELRRKMKPLGAKFKTGCDTETVLWSYIIYGDDCVELLNGIFAFAVYDIYNKRVFFARDRLGVKPFYYSQKGDEFVFGSEMKSLLTLPEISRKIEKEGIWQLIFLTPVTLKGRTVFKDIMELPPAYCGSFSESGLDMREYWRLRAKEFKGTAEDAAAEVERLVCDAADRQSVSDVPLCTFLSGGLDSSVLTAVIAEKCRKQGTPLSTYSFEYENNKQSFRKSLFQPQGDDEYAVFLAEHLGTDHTVLTAESRAVAECLIPAVKARDFPGQADIDSSLLYFCREVKRGHTVAISGECSDEIFGGYPWFYRPEMLYRDFFPFIHEPMKRAGLFDPDFADPDEGYAFLSAEYKKIIAEAPVLPTDSDSMRQSRIATCLSAGYFMTSLLERKDRMSMYSGLEVRVPFADHRIIEYVYNVPWEIKFQNGVEKALLRNAFREWLPDKILYRKKSPYPKTHDPLYREAVTKMLRERLKAAGGVGELLDKEVLSSTLSGEDETWFGQLMSTPQLIAWLVQFDVFIREYGVDFA